MTYFKLLSFGFGLVFIGTGLRAQDPIIASFDYLKDKYEDENVIILEQKESVQLKIEDDSLRIYSKHHTDRLCLQHDQTGGMNEYIFHNQTFNKISNIQGKKLYPVKNKKYKSSNYFEVSEQSRTGPGIFYDDNKLTIVGFYGTSPGDRTVVSFDEEITDPHFLGVYYFADYSPIIKSEYAITFPKEVKIKFKTFNTDKINLNFEEKSNSDGTTTFIWTADTIQKFTHEEGAPSISYSAPHVAVLIEEFESSKGKEPILSDVSTLYSWYKSLIKQVNKDEPSKELAAVVDSLIHGAKSDREKAEKIYYWVQDNIKYVAFEDGMNGFVPREANAVCTKKYGDCKDMSSILKQMMQMAGLEASLTWIGTRHIPYKYTELPTPSADNHMIASVLIDGERIILDATGQFQPLGLPTSMIQGKQALIEIDEENYEIYEIPVIPKEENILIDSTFFKVGHDSIYGSCREYHRGYMANEMGYFLKRKTEKNRKEFIQMACEKGSDRFEVTDYGYSGVNQISNEIQLNIDFIIPEYSRTIDNSIYLNMNLRKSLPEKIDTVERTQAIEIDYKHMEHIVNVLEIPDGYSIKFLPENTQFESEGFGFTLEYKQKGDKLICELVMSIDTLLLEPEQHSEWNKMIAEMDSAFRKSIVLNK